MVHGLQCDTLYWQNRAQMLTGIAHSDLCRFEIDVEAVEAVTQEDCMAAVPDSETYFGIYDSLAEIPCRTYRINLTDAGWKSVWDGCQTRFGGWAGSLPWRYFRCLAQTHGGRGEGPPRMGERALISWLDGLVPKAESSSDIGVHSVRRRAHASEYIFLPCRSGRTGKEFEGLGCCQVSEM